MQSRNKVQQTVRNLAAGGLAGVVGTAAMDSLLYLRYRRGGGTQSLWE